MVHTNLQRFNVIFITNIILKESSFFFSYVWLEVHKVNVFLGEKKKFKVQTVSHGSLEMRTSEGAVPSAGYVPAFLNKDGYRGCLLPGQSCTTKHVSAVCSMYLNMYQGWPE